MVKLLFSTDQNASSMRVSRSSAGGVAGRPDEDCASGIANNVNEGIEVVGAGLQSTDLEADHHVCHLLSADVSACDGRPHQSDAVKRHTGIAVVAGPVVGN